MRAVRIPPDSRKSILNDRRLRYRHRYRKDFHVCYIPAHAEFIFLSSGGRGMKRGVVFNGKARGIPYSSLDTRIRLLEVLELNHDLIVIAV
jgi:hypothetical protein